MASRRALDAKFEVRILDPQHPNSLEKGSFFVKIKGHRKYDVLLFLALRMQIIIQIEPFE